MQDIDFDRTSDWLKAGSPLCKSFVLIRQGDIERHEDIEEETQMICNRALFAIEGYAKNAKAKRFTVAPYSFEQSYYQYLYRDFLFSISGIDLAEGLITAAVVVTLYD